MPRPSEEGERETVDVENPQPRAEETRTKEHLEMMESTAAGNTDPVQDRPKWAKGWPTPHDSLQKVSPVNSAVLLPQILQEVKDRKTKRTVRYSQIECASYLNVENNFDEILLDYYHCLFK
ncbi:uncharacterized protein LOC128174630 [Crassostrea angulata]|uniref:uncharacterized protein LOC128174630 n=1 Tax=Magallana angulata TaxID=2784310 RepID=UPI0022B1F6EF|nr:uncharacterized protein LOC128174630 [Crassostrea angulata]